MVRRGMGEKGQSIDEVIDVMRLDLEEEFIMDFSVHYNLIFGNQIGLKL